MGENAELRELVKALSARLDALEQENAELRRQLGSNSRNSTKPPSPDSPFVKPAPKSLRRKSRRKPDGQPGHPGSTSALVDDPNERKRHEPGDCAGDVVALAAVPGIDAFDIDAATASQPNDLVLNFFDGSLAGTLGRASAYSCLKS